MDLREIQIQPVGSSDEGHFQALMQTHHPLGALPKIGHTLWYVATWRGAWVALLSFSAAAWKCAARDRWIGWSFRHQYDRLHLVVNNSRFLILPEHHHPNLASRVLALSERRLKGDWPRHFGYPLLMLETFVDPARFQGTVYRAANWHYVGDTRGFRRTRSGYTPNGSHPKRVFLRPLHPQAPTLLARSFLEARYQKGAPKLMVTAEQMRQLPAFFKAIPDPRRIHGRRHPLTTVLGLAAAATLAGARGYKEIAQWCQDLSPKARQRFGCRRENGRYVVPSTRVIRDVLIRVDPDPLDQVMQQWNAQYAAEDESLAIDGKTMCGTGNETGHQVHILGVMGHQSRRCYAQKK